MSDAIPVRNEEATREGGEKNFTDKQSEEKVNIVANSPGGLALPCVFPTFERKPQEKKKETIQTFLIFSIVS